MLFCNLQTFCVLIFGDCFDKVFFNFWISFHWIYIIMSTSSAGNRFQALKCPRFSNPWEAEKGDNNCYSCMICTL